MKEKDKRAAGGRSGSGTRSGSGARPAGYTDKSDTRVFNPINEKNKKPAAHRPVKKKAGSGTVVFFVTTVFVGVLVCVFAFSLVFKSMRDNGGEGNASTATVRPSATASSAPSGTETAVRESITAVVSSLDSSAASLRLFNPDTGQTGDYQAGDGTEMKDKYGNALSLGGFSPGDIVDAVYETVANSLVSMKMSSQAITYREITDVDVDAEGGTLSIGNERYSYGDNTICLYNGAAFTLGQLDTADIVTVNVYKGTAYYVGLVKGHGSIRLLGHEGIVNGMVEMGGTVYAFPDSGGEIKVSEGTYRATITGANIEPYMREITIANNAVTELSLEEVMLKSGVLTVSSSVPGAAMTIDGASMNVNEPLILDYGTHSIVVTADGYMPYEGEISLTEPQMDLTVELEAIATETNLTVSSDPEGAYIYIDGMYVGVAPITVTVEYGAHSITAMKNEYLTAAVNITVTTDMTNVTIPMQPATGVLAD